MRVIFSFLILIIYSSLIFANDKISFYHDVPTGVIQGEKAHIELTSNNMKAYGFDIRDVILFYRELGRDRFNSISMKEEGFSYTIDLNTSTMNTGQIEYYFAFRDRRGGVGTFPADVPQLNPYVMRIAPAQSQEIMPTFEIVVLSPDLNEILPDDEVVISASVIGGESDIDFDQSRLLIDGVNVTALADFSDGIITFVPDNIRVGRHNIELQLYDNDGNILQNQEWAFRATDSGMKATKVNYRGSFFADNRSQNIVEQSDNFFRGGGYFTGNYKNLDFYTRVVFSSEEADDIQPVNRYSAEFRYNFTERDNLYLKGGDFIPYYNPLTFQDKRVRGIQTGLAYGLFTFDFLYGQTSREIEGQDSVTVDNIFYPQANGVYAENITAYRPGFRFGERATWNLNLINSKEDEESIKYGGNVKEALVLGTDLSLNYDNRRIIFEGSFQASIQNTNAGGPEVDDLAAIDSSLAENDAAKQALDFLKSTGFLSITPGLSPLPSMAMQFDLYLRYFKNNFKFTYLKVDRDFASPGNPYLLKDRSGIHIFDNIRLFENQVFLNLFYKAYQNNLADDDFTTDNSEIGTTVSYFPQGNYPSIILGYTSYSRNNGVKKSDIDSLHQYLYVEDNSSNQINFGTRYDVNLNNIRNTLMLNFTNMIRDDLGNKELNRDFNSFTIGVRSKFDFPLTTKISYSQSTTDIGDTTSYTTDINRINLNLEYKFYDLIDSDILRPFLNVTFQGVDVGENSTDRNNFSTGIVYQSTQYGIFSLKYYQISYTIPASTLTQEKDYSDSIVNVRYEYLF